MHHSILRRPRLARTSAATLAVSLLATLLAACTPTTPPGQPSNAQFCEFWEKVEEAPPTVDNAVLVKDEVVALAEDTLVIGNECTDPNARVDLDGAVLAEGEEVPSELDTPDAPPIAAVTGDEIAAEAPVLENLTVKTLSAEISSSGIRVRGNVAVRLSGTTSTIGFVGTLRDLDNWSVTLSSTAFQIPGITTAPATFSGTLQVTGGVPTLSLSASNITTARVGDVTLTGTSPTTGASIDLIASPQTGVSASVHGMIKVGPSTATGSVQVDFDRVGTLVSARAEIAAHLVGTQAGGKKIDLQGTLKLEGNATQTVASFSGSGIVGDLVVNQASGSLTLGVNKATFVGVLDVASGPNTLRYNGSIVWDGQTAYTPYMNIEGAGEFSGTLADGQRASVSGTLSLEAIGGQVRSVVTGDFQVGTLRATGKAIVETNGASTTLYVDANLVNAGFAAKLEGAVVITDGVAELVELDAAVQGSVQLGDVTLTGATLKLRSTYGSTLDISFTGGLKVGSRADLNGAVNASFGPNGSLLSLTGNMDGSLLLDSWGILGFQGSVVATPDRVTLTGSGGVSLINFPLGMTFNGSFTSSLTSPSWTLHGTGRFRIASIDVASARLSLSQTAGMKATRVGFYFSILGIPTYFEGDFYLKPAGGCEKVDITGGSFLAKPLLKLVLPGVIGCPVN